MSCVLERQFSHNSFDNVVHTSMADLLSTDGAEHMVVGVFTDHPKLHAQVPTPGARCAGKRLLHHEMDHL